MCVCVCKYVFVCVNGCVNLGGREFYSHSHQQHAQPLDTPTQHNTTHTTRTEILYQSSPRVDVTEHVTHVFLRRGDIHLCACAGERVSSCMSARVCARPCICSHCMQKNVHMSECQMGFDFMLVFARICTFTGMIGTGMIGEWPCV